MSQNDRNKNSGAQPPNNLHLRLKPRQTRWLHDQTDEDRPTPQEVIRDLIEEKRGANPRKPKKP